MTNFKKKPRPLTQAQYNRNMATLPPGTDHATAEIIFAATNAASQAITAVAVAWDAVDDWPELFGQTATRLLASVLASTPKDTGDTEAAIAMLRYVEGKLREADAAWQQEEAAAQEA